MIAAEAAVAIERAALLDRLELLAHTDDLTGLINRRAWDLDVVREVARARRDDTPLAVAMLDLDRFKAYNDEHGHQAGDRVLREAASAWRAVLRETDLLARYGGEEFAVAFPGCEREHAQALVERLREVTPAGQSCSAGLACWDGRESADALLGRADKALYDAKQSGRDRTVVAVDNSEEMLRLRVRFRSAVRGVAAGGQACNVRCGWSGAPRSDRLRALPSRRGRRAGAGFDGVWISLSLGRARRSACAAGLRWRARPRGARGSAAAARRRSSATPGIAFAADGIDAGYAPLAYAGAGRRLVAALKFSRLLVVAELGAALIADGAPADGVDGDDRPGPGRSGPVAAPRLRSGLGDRRGARRADRLRARPGASPPRPAAASAAARGAPGIAEPPRIEATGPAPAMRPARRRRRHHRGDDDGACARALRAAGSQRRSTPSRSQRFAQTESAVDGRRPGA